MKRSLLGVALFVALVGCDHATKAVAESELRGRPPTQVIGNLLALEYHQNHGIAFNLERFVPEALHLPLFSVGVIAVLGILFVAWRRRTEMPLHEGAAYACVAAGAAGNLIDRVMRGYVVDFIHLQYWPVFNVADALLVVGVLLLFLPQRQAAGKATS
jgi:signal peptidase II